MPVASFWTLFVITSTEGRSGPTKEISAVFTVMLRKDVCRASTFQTMDSTCPAHFSQAFSTRLPDRPPAHQNGGAMQKFRFHLRRPINRRENMRHIGKVPPRLEEYVAKKTCLLIKRSVIWAGSVMALEAWTAPCDTLLAFRTGVEACRLCALHIAGRKCISANWLNWPSG